MFYDHPVCPYGCKDKNSSSDYKIIQGLYEQIPKEDNGRYSFKPFIVICPSCKKKFNLLVNIDYIFESEGI